MGVSKKKNFPTGKVLLQGLTEDAIFTLEIFTHLDRVDELICEENILHF